MEMLKSGAGFVVLYRFMLVTLKRTGGLAPIKGE
jgi:hypothetical protein